MSNMNSGAHRSASPDPATPSGSAQGGSNNIKSDEDLLQEFEDVLATFTTDNGMPGTSSQDMSKLPEMLEDVLEVITEDKNYMKSSGLTEDVRCVFCEWTGPVLLIEGHIRKDHACSIHNVDSCVSILAYLLENLSHCNVWLHKVIEHDSTLYLMSAKYVHPGGLMAKFRILSPDLLVPSPTFITLTIFNNRTGESLTWTRKIPILGPNSAENDRDLFDINLTKLNLVPSIPGDELNLFVRFSA